MGALYRMKKKKQIRVRTKGWETIPLPKIKKGRDPFKNMTKEQKK